MSVEPQCHSPRTDLICLSLMHMMIYTRICASFDIRQATDSLALLPVPKFCSAQFNIIDVSLFLISQFEDLECFMQSF